MYREYFMESAELGEFKTVMKSVIVENSPNPSSVYNRLCKYRKKVFYCFNKLTFPRKNAKQFVMSLIKRESLTSRQVLYTKSCTHNQFLSCKKEAFQNTDFSRLKCHLNNNKTLTQHIL